MCRQQHPDVPVSGSVAVARGSWQGEQVLLVQGVGLEPHGEHRAGAPRGVGRVVLHLSERAVSEHQGGAAPL